MYVIVYPPLPTLGTSNYLVNNNVFIILTRFVETTDNSLNVMSYLIFHVVEQCEEQLGRLKTQKIHLYIACVFESLDTFILLSTVQSTISFSIAGSIFEKIRLTNI